MKNGGKAGVEEERRGGGGKKVCQKWPDKIFPTGNFVYFPKWSLWSGGGGRYPPSSCGVRPF